MTRALSVVILATIACAPKEAPPTCAFSARDQVSNLARSFTCLQRELRAALVLCENERPLIPIPNDQPWVEGAPGLSVDECLQKWVPNLDACADERDQQWACELRPAAASR